MRSKLGWVFAGAYVLTAAYLIYTQGLFGESFIAIILGMPWALLPSFFEYGGGGGFVLMHVLIFGPMALNTVLLYWIGSMISRLFERRS